MKDLRNLLIDCRIELRKNLREFHKTELCLRLDQAIQNATALAESAAATQASAENPTGKAGAPTPGGHDRKHTTHQVALAWQMVTRDLKFSDPPLYDSLRAKVLTRIEAKTLVDESTELREIEGQLAKLQAALDQQAQQSAVLELEHDSLVSALSLAVPELADGGDRLAVAVARIEWLKTQKSIPAPISNSGAAKTSAPVDQEGPVPNVDVLALVASGARKFTDHQREWSVGEAMVLSGFQYTPVELLDMGDARVASVIIGAQSA